MDFIKKTYIEILLLVYLAFALTFAEIQKRAVPCRAISVFIDKYPPHYFVDKDQVKRIIMDKGERTTGNLIGRINILKLEKAVRANPSIERADVYRQIDGRLCVSVRQRNPIVRIINNTSESYYIDEKGAMMPLCDRYTARVPIANGMINEPYASRYTTDVMSFGGENRKTVLKDIFQLTSYIHQNEFLTALVEQVYVDYNRDFIVVPKIGPTTIVVGSVDDLDEKFRKLWIMYKKALPLGGWDKYSKIDLQYKNQVVCTKK